MNPLESLALLIADLNSQVRSQQAENAALRARVAELEKQAQVDPAL